MSSDNITPHEKKYNIPSYEHLVEEATNFVLKDTLTKQVDCLVSDIKIKINTSATNMQQKLNDLTMQIDEFACNIKNQINELERNINIQIDKVTHSEPSKDTFKYTDDFRCYCKSNVPIVSINPSVPICGCTRVLPQNEPRVPYELPSSKSRFTQQYAYVEPPKFVPRPQTEDRLQYTPLPLLSQSSGPPPPSQSVRHPPFTNTCQYTSLPQYNPSVPMPPTFREYHANAPGML